MAKGASKSAVRKLECREVSSVNTDELESALMRAELRVLKIQTKLHRWAPRTRDGACGEPAASTRRTAGSGGGSGRRTGRKAGTAPRVDLTTDAAQPHDQTNAPKGRLLVRTTEQTGEVPHADGPTVAIIVGS